MKELTRRVERHIDYLHMDRAYEVLRIGIWYLVLRTRVMRQLPTPYPVHPVRFGPVESQLSQVLDVMKSAIVMIHDTLPGGYVITILHTDGSNNSNKFARPVGHDDGFTPVMLHAME